MTRERYLSDDELERLMAAVRGRRHVNQPRDHAFFALLANTGLRPMEARQLIRSDLHLSGRRPWVRVKRVVRMHSPHPLERLFLNRRVAGLVARYADSLEPGAKLFPFSARQSARLFHWYSGKAGLSPHYRIYALRHTVGMRLYRHTKDVRLMQAVMGHGRLKSAMCYDHVDSGAIVAALERAGVVS
jgi:integrase